MDGIIFIKEGVLMKRVFSILVSVLLAAQAMVLPAWAVDMGEVEVPADEGIVLPEDAADAVFTFSDVKCAPGDEIAVEVSIASTAVINSVSLSGLKYDTDSLEFLGFANSGPVIGKSMFGELGIDRENNTIVVGLLNAEPLTGKICDLLFRVKDEGYSISEVSMDVLVKNNTEIFTSSVETATVAAGYVDFTFGEVISDGEGTIEVPVFVDTPFAVNSIGLHGFEYDTELLTFVGFSDYGSIVTGSLFGDSGLDVENQAITIGLTESKPVSGRICNLVFAVNEGAGYGKTEIRAESLVKNFSDEIYSSVEPVWAFLGRADFDIGYVQGLPGDTVYVDVSAVEGASPVDFLEFSDLVYDTERLTFLGFCVGDETVLSDSYAVPMDEAAVPEGELFRLAFLVNEGAEGGIAEISLSSAAGNGGAEFSSKVDGGFVAVGKTDIVIGSTICSPGKVAEIDLLIDSTAPVGSVELMQIEYDASVMTFEGVTFDSELVLDCGWYGGDGAIYITVLAAEGALLSDVHGKLSFSIHEEAEECVISIAPREVDALYQMIPFMTSVTAGSVEIKHPVVGDLGGDFAVDLQDSMLLFQNSMMPELYPVEYSGTLDITRDSKVDILDALLLFRHSMMPDLYPIGW